MMYPYNHHANQYGFSLIEMAIVLFIVALLMGGLLPTISSQLEQKNRNETKKQLDEIQQSLFGYVISKGYLPCPAKSASDGTEDRIIATGACNKRIGFLPWVELSTQKADSWGRLFTYSVTPAFSNWTTTFTLTTPRDITIKTRDTAGLLTNLSNANDIPAVVLSHGANGIYGTSENGIVISSAAPSSKNVDDQKSNALPPAGTSAGVTFVNRDHAAPSNGTDEVFDDIVIAISPNTLFIRMVTSGRLTN
jgi:prepilin-type N-terminal cleavage/methylation domain-containing protein